MGKSISKTNKLLTLLFSFLCVVIIVVMAVDSNFFEWTFARHQNILSWYIRPLFLIPLCFFAYRHNPFGIALTTFLLLTSMFWFPEPAAINDKVKEFLIMEKNYLTTNWSVSKVLISLLVPLSLYLLARAFWKRSIKTGISIIVIIAIAKTLWSIFEGGISGQAVIIPAIIGLVVCIVVIYYGYRQFEKNKKK
jgi:glucose-6-phosphate-specific signal transduction histidine kinase